MNKFYVATDGCRIAYRDEGPRDAPLVALCTMGQSAMTVWDSLVAGLSDRWRVVRHDRRGDGESDPGSPLSHTFEQYSRDVVGLMDDLSARTVFLMGMAFGARVAVRAALDFPERVAGLVLFDATGGSPAPELAREEGRRLAADLRAKSGLNTPHIEPAWFARRDREGRGLGANALLNQPAWIPGLAGIVAPTLIACGEQDPNLAGSKRMAGEIAGAAFTLMPMTGHASILDRPDLVLSITREFLETH